MLEQHRMAVEIGRKITPETMGLRGRLRQGGLFAREDVQSPPERLARDTFAAFHITPGATTACTIANKTGRAQARPEPTLGNSNIKTPGT